MPASKLTATKLPRPQVTALCVQLRLKRRRAAEAAEAAAAAAVAMAAVEAASAASGAELPTFHSAGSAGSSEDTTAATTAGDTATTAASASHMLPAALLSSVMQPSGLSSTEEATEQYSSHMSNRLTSSGAAMGQHGSGSEAKGSQPTPWSLHGSVAMEMLRAASAKEPSLKRDDPYAPRAALAQTLIESVVDKRAHATSRQLRRLQDPEEDGVLLEALVDGRAQATSSCIRPRGPINPRQIAVRLGGGGGEEAELTWWAERNRLLQPNWRVAAAAAAAEGEAGQDGRVGQASRSPRSVQATPSVHGGGRAGIRSVYDLPVDTPPVMPGLDPDPAGAWPQSGDADTEASPLLVLPRPDARRGGKGLGVGLDPADQNGRHAHRVQVHTHTHTPSRPYVHRRQQHPHAQTHAFTPIVCRSTHSGPHTHTVERIRSHTATPLPHPHTVLPIGCRSLMWVGG